VRYIIMHKTNPRWEAGEIPSPELVARVGAMIAELARAKVLEAGEGLRSSSLGVRLRASGGKVTVTSGPFEGDDELPAGFTILTAQSIDEVIDWASRQAAVLGDAEVDIRPVTEPWDIGMSPRPANATTTRYMALRKATAASEAGVPLAPKQQQEMTRLVDEAKRNGSHLATENIRPSSRGRRLRKTRSGVTMTDGPFAESKELIGGYVIVTAESLDDATRWATLYIGSVEAEEVDVRELESRPSS
jgi:hypothetical protein